MNIELAVLDKQIDKAKELLVANGLSYDSDIDVTLLAIEEEAVGTISLSSNVIKCLSVSEDFQGMGIALKLVSKVVEYLFSKGVIHYFAYTKANNFEVFRGLGMTEVVTVDGITLFEGGFYNISTYLKEFKSEHSLDQEYAALVMNLNPMTNGHLYLIEKAAKENKNVILFVVEEDKSIFPFDLRYTIAKEACVHLENVKVLPSTEYMISKATFSTYFIKDQKIISELFAKIDFEIFTKYFAKILGITKRYIGTEPYCVVTSAYNDVMLDSSFEMVLVERKTHNDKSISASLVRELMEKDIKLIKEYVPDATYKNLIDFRR